ncbi:hypothetical protein QF026_008560 [Streptomyces aurantiacus]|nr:hypothetical protein [Streptomyces aurantiacus]
METTITISSGHHIPRLGFGTYQIPPRDTEQVATEALQPGYRHIDTASYYRNEAGVGAAVRPCGLVLDSSKDLKPVYTAPSEAAATERFLEFSEKWANKYPAVIKLWSDAWAEMVPFLSFDVEIRKVICSTNAIESVNARIRKAVRARGHFPNEAAALKCVYMALMSLDPTGKGRRRWTMRWKAPLNAFQIAFEGRLTPTTSH